MRFITNQPGITLEQAIEVLLQPRKALAIDIETVSIKNPLPLGIGVAISSTVGYYFFNTKDPLLMEVVGQTPILPYHNCKFDMPLMRGMGYTINGYEDTKMLAYALGYMDTTLAGMSMEFLRPCPSVTDLWESKDQGNINIDHVKLGQICMTHAMNTYLLWEKLARTPLYEDIDKPCIELLIEMEKWGLLVDQYRLTQLEYEVYAKAKRLKMDLLDELGNINLASNLQVAKALQSKGILGTRKTKAGKDSVSDESLRPLNHPTANKILDWRSEMKTLTTYVPAFRNVDATGRMHTKFGYTSTGRWSSSDPNHQNLTRDEKFNGMTLRSCIAAEPGYTFVSLDASQIELRVVAILSQDPLMLQALKEKDLHMATAIQVFGYTDDVTLMKERRYNAKQLNFAILYGADAEKVAEMAGCTIGEAEELIEQYFNTYRVLHRWIKGIHKGAKESGYVTNLFGRKRQIPELISPNWRLREKGERESVNTIVQGTAVDIVKRMMLYLRGELSSQVRLVLQVHDEILWETPLELLQHTLDTIAGMYPAFPDYPCTLKIGEYYGELKEVVL